MLALDFETTVWLAAAICAVFALAGALLASSLGSNAFVRRLVLANLAMFVCMLVRLVACPGVRNTGYVVVWSLWAAASLLFISALRLNSDQPSRDRELVSQWAVIVGLMLGTALLTPVAQVVALVASVCLLLTMALCFMNAMKLDNPRLRPIRHWLTATFAIGTIGVATHIPLRVTELLAGQASMAHSGATYVFLLLLWVASNVGLMLLVQSRLALRVAALAHSDELTGLLNRRGLFEHLAEESLQGQPASSGVLMMFDIDHFKLINDRYGHETGDEVLRWFAGQLRAHVRAGDCQVRFGGEEFVWMLSNISVLQGAAIAERLRRDFSERLRCDFIRPPARITVSVGLVEFSGQLADLKAALARADEALYTAKHAGRDQVRCWNPQEVPASVPITSQQLGEAAVV